MVAHLAAAGSILDAAGRLLRKLSAAWPQRSMPHAADRPMLGVGFDGTCWRLRNPSVDAVAPTSESVRCPTPIAFGGCWRGRGHTGLHELASLTECQPGPPAGESCAQGLLLDQLTSIPGACGSAPQAVETRAFGCLAWQVRQAGEVISQWPVRFQLSNYYQWPCSGQPVRCSDMSLHTFQLHLSWGCALATADRSEP